jgi:hypothetical protein
MTDPYTPHTASALTIDQTIQMGADQWEIAFDTSEAWRNRNTIDSADLSIGLINALGGRDVIKQVTEGFISEHEIQIEPNKLIARMRGLDAMAFAAQTTLFITYVTGGVLPPIPSLIRPELLNPNTPGQIPPGLRPIPGVTTHLFLPGLWRASTVCADLAARVGLVCSYQAPDYILREDLNVSGSVFSAIQQLIAPLCNFEPFKVDVWTEGKTLMIRQRQGLVEEPGPLGPVPSILNTISVAEARITTFLIRSHFLGQIRLFRAIGAFIICPDPNAAEPFAETIEQTAAATDGLRSINLRINTNGLRRLADGAEMIVQKETWDLDESTLVSREVTTHFWDGALTDTNCKIINSPLERGSQTRIENIDPTDAVFRHTSTVTVNMTYDHEDFLVLQTTETESLVDNKFVTTKKEVLRYFDNGAKLHKVETTTFTGGTEGLTLESSSNVPGSGPRPGGPGRAMRETAGGVRAFAESIIDNNPGAKDFTLQNVSMTQTLINTIQTQAKASSGAFEYEVQFTAANIPWLKKGMMLSLTGMTFEDGSPFVLPNMFVMDTRIIHTENNAQPSSLTQVKCLFWSKTYN